jgi:hypothetical protein
VPVNVAADGPDGLSPAQAEQAKTMNTSVDR